MPKFAILCEPIPTSSFPAKRAEPLTRGGLSPMIAAQSVVFPIPLRPTIATAWSPSSKETSVRTCALP